MKEKGGEGLSPLLPCAFTPGQLHEQTSRLVVPAAGDGGAAVGRCLKTDCKKNTEELVFFSTPMRCARPLAERRGLHCGAVAVAVAVHGGRRGRR